MSAWTTTDASASDHYLLLADISGYSTFMTSVGQAHGVDFSGGIPAGYAVLGRLLDAVVQGVEPDFDVAKLEGDAVFAIADADALDGHGDKLLSQLRTVHRSFHEQRMTASENAQDHICVACPAVAGLDLKMVLHRGQVVRQTVGSRSELLGPAVNVAHRLLKNNVQARIGYKPYLFVTDVAGDALALAEPGLEHDESYPDVGAVHGRVIDLTDA